MADNSKNKLEALTDKYTEGFESFSNSKSGNIILDFIAFKRNLIPYTLQIIYVIGVLAIWVFAILGVFKQGPFANLAQDQYFLTLGISIAAFVLAPFVLHYALELVKIAWKFLVYVFHNVIVPIWNTVVIRFFANTLPQIYPFLFERFMTVCDVFVAKTEPFLAAFIGMIDAIGMTLASVLKSVVWLPKKVCQRIGRWLDKSSEDKADK